MILSASCLSPSYLIHGRLLMVGGGDSSVRGCQGRRAVAISLNRWGRRTGAAALPTAASQPGSWSPRTSSPPVQVAAIALGANQLGPRRPGDSLCGALGIAITDAVENGLVFLCHLPKGCNRLYDRTWAMHSRNSPIREAYSLLRCALSRASAKSRWNWMSGATMAMLGVFPAARISCRAVSAAGGSYV